MIAAGEIEECADFVLSWWIGWLRWSREKCRAVGSDKTFRAGRGGVVPPLEPYEPGAPLLLKIRRPDFPPQK
jgi:hypothetical protein